MIDDAPAGFARNDPSAMGDRIMTDERAAFEKWAVEEMDLTTGSDGCGGYHNTRTDHAWMAWNARAALPTAPALEPVAWRYRNQNGGSYFLRHDKPTGELAELQPLYASPPHQTESETREEIRKELSFDFPSPTGDEDK